MEATAHNTVTTHDNDMPLISVGLAAYAIAMNLLVEYTSGNYDVQYFAPFAHVAAGIAGTFSAITAMITLWKQSAAARAKVRRYVTCIVWFIKRKIQFKARTRFKNRLK